MKLFYGIFFFFSDRNIDSNEKSFPPFQVRGNDAVTERLLTAKFRSLESLFSKQNF